MRFRVLATLMGILASGTGTATASDHAAALKKIDALYKQALAVRRQMPEASEIPDIRGRHAADDLRDWVVPEADVKKIAALRTQAKSKDPATADAAVAELTVLVNEDWSRAQWVKAYWDKASSAPYWRRNWQAFAEANKLPPEPPDPGLLDIDRRLVAQLDAGNFQDAVRITIPEFDAAFRAMVGGIRGSLAKQTPSAILDFIPHRYPCIFSQRPKPPREFYPPGARRRFEEGSVILRTKMNADGCGLATAIVVSTGSPELDQAGLETAQFTRFAAGTEAGKPIASEVTYSVKFVLKD